MGVLFEKFKERGNRMNRILAIFSALGSATFWLLGGKDSLLLVLAVLICLDFFAGFSRAWITKTVSSQRMREGFTAKVMVFVIIIVANMVDIMVGQNIFRNFVCIFYAAVEGLSIMENASALGLPIPEGLKDTLVQLKTDGRKQPRDK